MKRIKILLLHPHFSVFLIGLTLLLTMSACWTGFQIDDYFIKMFFYGGPFNIDFDAEPRLDVIHSLFNFLDEKTTEPVQEKLERGIIPWWSSRSLHVTFWRPIAGFFHWLDFKLWGKHPWLMHFHSMLWYAGIVFLVFVLYRRFFKETLWIAGLAGVLYALDDAHGMTVGWLANRNALIASFFGFLVLYFHLKWREERWRFGVVLGPLVLFLGLLSAEYAVSVLAYLVAFALVLDKADWKSRLLSLTPYFATIITWRICYQMTDSYAQGSAIYIDPLKEPFLFLSAIFVRSPVLLLSQWAGPPSDFFIALPSWGRFVQWLLGVCVIIMLGWFLYPLIKQKAIARFWLTGMSLSLVPVCATFPMDRLLLFIGFGAMGLTAQFIGHVLDPETRATWGIGIRRKATAFAYVLVAIHLIISPLMLPLRTCTMALIWRDFDSAMDSVQIDPSGPGRDVMVINAPNMMMVGYIALIKRIDQEPEPDRTFMLATGMVDVSVTRIDEDTLSVKPDGGYPPDMSWLLVRKASEKFKAGDQIKFSFVTITIPSVNENGMPLEAVFRFNRSVEDSSFLWYRWEDGRYVTFTPPKLGETVTLTAYIWP